MPNYVKNRIQFSDQISQEKMDELYSKVLSVDRSEDFFDFNLLIPMPESLNIEKSSDSDMGHILYCVLLALSEYSTNYQVNQILQTDNFKEIFPQGELSQIKTDYYNLLKTFHPDHCSNPKATEVTKKINLLYEQAVQAVPYIYKPDTKIAFFDPWSCFAKDFYADRLRKEISIAGFDPNTDEGIRSFAETDHGKRMLDLGAKIARNIQLYGAETWYEWCCEHWATKWNSCRNSIDRDGRCIEFSTAWSVPCPIAEKLAELFPDVPFVWTFASEDCGYQTGVLENKSGHLETTLYEDESSKAYELYVQAFGANNPCLYKTKEGLWAHYDCDSCPHHAECFGDGEDYATLEEPKIGE